MQYSRAKCIIVYDSLRHIFGKPENAAIRKSKAIKAVVQRHRLTVSYYSEKELVQILQHLLKQGIFESKDTARSIYPELFLLPAVQKQTEQVPKPYSVPDRNLSIMEEQSVWWRQIFHTGEYSDIDLVSTSKRYEVHRVIVCPWSPVIKKSCEFNAGKASFDFGGADPQAVDCIVQFFYLWDYNLRSLMPECILDQDGPQEDETDASLGADDATTPEAPLLILHAKVFTLAHIYDIPRLRNLSVKKFQAVAQLQWRSTCLLDAAREAYTATPSGVLEMRKAIVQTFYEHRQLLDKDEVKDFLREMHELAFDILMYINNPPSSLGFTKSKSPAGF
ncbi:hypothetical protein Forpe1208_v012550 [Fusarium oxysporum f. sp. rapae]|uniref:BTB domain-containing protein n=1 Tax=Fusarium oxysporum f. sp. rapae TaxID=485398 RepID=A0A8J5NLD7_FUSOX|nr:hypothetical protein Forpe1208_v012550 [Fusarium oxysporum f. sp. rapae]